MIDKFLQIQKARLGDIFWTGFLHLRVADFFLRDLRVKVNDRGSAEGTIKSVYFFKHSL